MSCVINIILNFVIMTCKTPHVRKVDVFANVLYRAINNTLKVKSMWTEIYGVSIQGIINFGKWLCRLNAMGDVRIMLLDP